ncbi:hypothetical protein AJ79_08642 [Helicocarpus griseus UAMH5409]|uniref:Uncharacterized protein n=1 Tax=Helicocarpus griseus UAMH5409 TaxID=1447875 RepID=A0A2B7WRG9_9EURO|nr:hypothetical protein AJ79_08642 [Helicocarpus griseus UAMH5409]
MVELKAHSQYLAAFRTLLTWRGLSTSQSYSKSLANLAANPKCLSSSVGREPRGHHEVLAVEPRLPRDKKDFWDQHTDLFRYYPRWALHGPTDERRWTDVNLLRWYQEMYNKCQLQHDKFQFANGWLDKEQHLEESKEVSAYKLGIPEDLVRSLKHAAESWVDPELMLQQDAEKPQDMKMPQGCWTQKQAQTDWLEQQQQQQAARKIATMSTVHQFLEEQDCDHPHNAGGQRSLNSSSLLQLVYDPSQLLPSRFIMATKRPRDDDNPFVKNEATFNSCPTDATDAAVENEKKLMSIRKFFSAEHIDAQQREMKI